MEAVRRVECMEKRRETNAATLEFRWRRMVLRMLVVLRIQTQVVLEAFDELAARGKPKAKSRKAGTSKEKRHGMCESQGGNAAPLRGFGRPLPPLRTAELHSPTGLVKGSGQPGLEVVVLRCMREPLAARRGHVGVEPAARGASGHSAKLPTVSLAHVAQAESD